MLSRFLASLLVAFASSSLSPAQSVATPQTARTDVPVTTVVLFSSGVGYFEHAGTVHGNGSTELRFRTSQMNDVLKSLVLQDQDGGKVSTITYPSQDPLSKTLKSFQVDITGNPSMAQLLNQLRGAHVSIHSQAERLSGTILGVETHRKPAEKGEAVETSVLNLLSGATIRSIELQSITSLSLDDAQLQDELTKALASLSQARGQDKKPVTIGFTGSGDRRVRLGYIVETPIWKTSYRLIMEGKGARLQGWAIVENQTESDWNNVSLSLVSGRPISFMMDLYAPLYVTRPTVIQEGYAALRPQAYEGGMNASDSSRAANVPIRIRGAASAGRVGYDAQGNPMPLSLESVVTTSLIDVASSVQSAATAGRMGELFQYTVGDVSLPRQKSAMIPIVTDTVDVERVSIYNASVLATNPLNGVRLKNTTGKNLLQGPITVLDKGNYAGDARIDNLPAGQERLLSYGIDLEMLVDNTKNTQTGTVMTAKINKGMLLLDRKFVSSQDYLADNKTGKDKVLVVEHPIHQGSRLVDTQKPYETTPGLYRFKITAAGRKVTQLTVREEMVSTQSIFMLPTDPAQLLTYSRTGEIPQPVRDAIAKAIQLKQGVLDVERQIAAHSSQITDIGTEQGRIRENMKTVGQSSAYYQRLLSKLNEQESSIEKLQSERDDLLAKRGRLHGELEAYLNGLTIG